jgi:hypothetical protein
VELRFLKLFNCINVLIKLLNCINVLWTLLLLQGMDAACCCRGWTLLVVAGDRHCLLLQGIDVAVVVTGADVGVSGANVGLVGVVEAGALESKLIVSIISSSSCVFLVMLRRCIW